MKFSELYRFIRGSESTYKKARWHFLLNEQVTRAAASFRLSDFEREQLFYAAAQHSRTYKNNDAFIDERWLLETSLIILSHRKPVTGGDGDNEFAGLPGAFVEVLQEYFGEPGSAKAVELAYQLMQAAYKNKNENVGKFFADVAVGIQFMQNTSAV